MYKPLFIYKRIRSRVLYFLDLGETMEIIFLKTVKQVILNEQKKKLKLVFKSKLVPSQTYIFDDYESSSTIIKQGIHCTNKLKAEKFGMAWDPNDPNTLPLPHYGILRNIYDANRIVINDVTNTITIYLNSGQVQTEHYGGNDLYMKIVYLRDNGMYPARNQEILS